MQKATSPRRRRCAWLGPLRPAPAGEGGAEDDRFWGLAFKAPRAESEADSWLMRQREFDADMWVIEVEDRQGRHFLDDFIRAY